VSGQLSLSNTGTDIRVYRGGTELTNKPAGFTSPQIDAYGVTGYQNQCRISVYSKSSHLTLANGWLPGSYITGVPAQMPNISGWTDPSTNVTAEIVYQVECEGRQTLYKTQSLSLQIEGSTGPGIVMRGEWSSLINYSGSVETRNFRRDAVIYGTNPTTYYAAISGSGPQTYNKQGTLVGSKAPTVGSDNAWWQYLGQQEFFVAAKIAIFDESFVKNTINVGNNSGSAFANIVLAGGREDPYMAVGQYSTIGYGNSGIWLGIYDDGTSASTFKPRFSLVNGDNSRFMKWTGTDLEIKGSITVTGGDAETTSGAQAKANAAQSAAISTAGSNATTALQIFSGSLGAMAAISQIQAGASAVTYIGAGAIVTNMVATNLITSTNYSASIEAAPYSNTGTFIDLANGNITSTGFAVKGDGTAYFKGTLNSSNATFGAWTLDNTAFSSANGRVTLKATSGDESISVLDSSNALRFLANTALSLPSPSAAQPTSFNTYGPGGTPVSYAATTSTNGDVDVSGTTFLNLTSFNASSNGGRHAATYTYNPASAYNTYAYAYGAASAYMAITLVITDNSNNVVSTGTTKSVYAYGTQYQEPYYGYGPPSGYSYLGGNNAYLADPSTFTVSAANLSASGAYKLQLQIYYQVYTNDTSGNPYYDDSTGYVNFQEPSISNTIVIQATSAGTYINGGGFLAAISDTRYLQVSEGLDGGAAANLTYSTKIKGNLNLVDGTVFSDLTTAPGYAPAVKAFCRLLYNGGTGGAGTIGNYSMQSAYNMASVSVHPTYRYYTHNFTTPLANAEYSTLVSLSNQGYVGNNITNVPMIVIQTSTYTAWRVKLLNNNVDYIEQSIVGGYAGVAVIGR
jgi:hypothetical protein